MDGMGSRKSRHGGSDQSGRIVYQRKAIYKHGSQNNGPAFPGDDPREFWQRAEDRNRNTADLYNRLGMAEYEAMEVFTRYKHDHGDSLK